MPSAQEHPIEVDPAHAKAKPTRIGCVSYLNSKPLIDGIEHGDRENAPAVYFDVPSRLLDDLQNERVDIALCPVIDFFESRLPLTIVPVGAIGCDGPTLTVRLFSQAPFPQVETIHADTDSHTSVVLAQILLREIHGVAPTVIDHAVQDNGSPPADDRPPHTLLLIGDKVVTDAPDASDYPYQMDLGEAWKSLTGLPFVFAIWMARAGDELGDLPDRLASQQKVNAGRIEAIVGKYAAAHGWESELATEYLRKRLRFAVGPRELQAVRHFGELAEKHKLLDHSRPLTIYDPVQ